MPIELVCPRCQTALTLSDDTAGSKIYCPGCRAKIRVPDASSINIARNQPQPARESIPSLPAAASRDRGTESTLESNLRSQPANPADAATVLLSSRFELQCPRCQSRFLVAAADIGKKGRCPQCKVKVRVPDVPPPEEERPRKAIASLLMMPADAPPLPAGASYQVGHTSSPSAGTAIKADADEPGLAAGWSPPVSSRVPARAKSGRSQSWVFPLLTFAILAGLAYWLVYRPKAAQDFSLHGTLVESFEGRAALDRELAGASTKTWGELAVCLEREPAVIDGESIELTFVGERKSLYVLAVANPSFRIVRIDPDSIPELKAWKREREAALLKQRQNVLKKSLAEFTTRLQSRCAGQSVDLRRHRHGVGLASLAHGFGFCLEGFASGETLPCVYEDAQGRIYFAIPQGLATFAVRGRQDDRLDVRFPGRIVVNVTRASEPKQAPRRGGR